MNNYYLPLQGFSGREMLHLENTIAFGDLAGQDKGQVRLAMNGYADGSYD